MEIPRNVLLTHELHHREFGLLIEIFQLSSAIQARAVRIPNAKSLAVNRRARACHPTLDHRLQDADMSANLMASVDHRNTATTGSARRPARSAEKVLNARESPTTEPFASAPRTTSARPSPSADQSATEMSTAPDRSQLATMESARILAMALAVLTLTATFVD
jgi:hypothetical protein